MSTYLYQLLTKEHLPLMANRLAFQGAIGQVTRTYQQTYGADVVYLGGKVLENQPLPTDPDTYVIATCLSALENAGIPFKNDRDQISYSVDQLGGHSVGTCRIQISASAPVNGAQAPQVASHGAAHAVIAAPAVVSDSASGGPDHLDAGVRRQLSYRHGTHSVQNVAGVTPAPKSPAWHVTASFFLPGLGTFLCGKKSWGLLIFGLSAVFMIGVNILADALIKGAPTGIGTFLAIPVWVWGMIDAYRAAQQWNREHAAPQASDVSATAGLRTPSSSTPPQQREPAAAVEVEHEEGREGRPRKVQGLLVMSVTPLDNSQLLMQQIIDQQRDRGHKSVNGSKAQAIVAGDSLEDPQYVYAAIRETFSEFDASDLMERTEQFSFQGSDGNQGHYYIVFDRPGIGLHGVPGAG